MNVLQSRMTILTMVFLGEDEVNINYSGFHHNTRFSYRIYVHLFFPCMSLCEIKAVEVAWNIKQNKNNPGILITWYSIQLVRTNNDFINQGWLIAARSVEYRQNTSRAAYLTAEVNYKVGSKWVVQPQWEHALAHNAVAMSYCQLANLHPYLGLFIVSPAFLLFLQLLCDLLLPPAVINVTRAAASGT